MRQLQGEPGPLGHVLVTLLTAGTTDRNSLGVGSFMEDRFFSDPPFQLTCLSWRGRCGRAEPIVPVREAEKEACQSLARVLPFPLTPSGPPAHRRVPPAAG